MLFTSISEMKAYGLLNRNIAWDSIAPYVAHAETLYVKPILGQSEYTALDVAISANTLTAAQTALLPYIRRMLYNATMWDALPHLNIYISELGVQQNQSKEGTSTPAARWQYGEARVQFGDMATRYAEALYQFLQDNQTDYPNWVAGEGYSKYNALLLRDNTELGRYLNTANSVRFYVGLRPFIETAMIRWVLSVVPQIDIDALHTALQAGTLTAADEKLLDKIRRVLAWGAYFDAIPHLSVRVTPTGIYIAMMSDALHDLKTPGVEETRRLLAAAQANAQMYQANLQAYWDELHPSAVPISNFYTIPSNDSDGAFFT
jgi:hypothetical protein